MKHWITLTLFPLSLAAHAYFGEVPETFTAKVTKKTTELTLQDLGEMEVEVMYPSDFQMSDLTFDAHQKDEEIQCRIHHQSLPKEEGESVLQNFSIRYEPQVEGTHAIELPLIHFQSKREPGTRHTLYPPSIECEVRMTREDPLEELEVAAPLTLDEAEPVELDSYNKKVFFQKSEEELKEVHEKFLSGAPSMKWKWFVYAFVLGFIAYKGYQLLSRKKTFKELFSTKEDPKERAMRALRNLKAKNLPKKGRFGDFYVEITQIVRDYIEGYYQIKAPEQTTQEFLQIVLNDAVFSAEINHYLTEFLKFADLVKFAKLNPKIEDCRHAEEMAENFILTEGKTSPADPTAQAPRSNS